MSDVKPYVAFEAVQLKERGEWRIQVTLPSGEQKQLGSFNTEAEAKEWIAVKSAAWLKLKQCEAARNL